MIEQRAAQCFEPMPWRADLSSRDMTTLLKSRLPDPATVGDVQRLFPKSIVGSEWVQLSVIIEKWFGLHVHWWVSKFAYDAESKLITSVTCRYGSDL